MTRLDEKNEIPLDIPQSIESIPVESVEHPTMPTVAELLMKIAELEKKVNEPFVVGQSAPATPAVVTELEPQSFEALVAKGVRGLLFPMINDGAKIKADISTNLLNGYPVGGITTGGDSVDSEEFQDQLLGDDFKTFLQGATDAGDITFNTYFNAAKGKPPIIGIRNSRVITPAFILILAIKSNTEGKLQGFFAAGVNYAGGNDIKADYGKAFASSLKFKISGKPKVGFDEVGLIDEELYGPLPYISAEDVEPEPEPEG